MAVTAVTRLGRFGPYLFVVPATTAIGALASTLAGSVAVIAIGAMVGLGWGVLVGRIAGWLSRRKDGDLKLANRSMLLAVLTATTLFGGSLFAMMLYAAASSAREIVLFLMRPPHEPCFLVKPVLSGFDNSQNVEMTGYFFFRTAELIGSIKPAMVPAR